MCSKSIYLPENRIKISLNKREIIVGKHTCIRIYRSNEEPPLRSIKSSKNTPPPEVV